MNGETDYSRLKFYPKSKLYNVHGALALLIEWLALKGILPSVQVMTAHALQRRLQNVGITVSSLHPGAVSSAICT